jgi:O-antigen ligase
MNISGQWPRQLLFYSCVAVLFTTLFGWFNLNSLSIILLVFARLLCGNPKTTIRAAFADKLFVAYFIFYLIETAGYLHTHDWTEQGKVVSKEATLVAMAFVLCTGSFAEERSFRRLATWYSLLIAAASVYCLIVALGNYLQTRDGTVFFYHSLTRPISQNAVFFALYVVFALLFLLAPGGSPDITGLPVVGRRALRRLLVAFFLVMIVLLNSKLVLVISVLILAGALTRKVSFGKNRPAVMAALAVIVLGLCAVSLTDNPIRTRYREMTDGNLRVVRQESFNPGMYFNSLQLRLLEWRFGMEILKDRHAWVFGVSPGDSQGLLDQKYIATNMYIGNPADGPHRKIRGFIGYNFHNQYLETLVRSGLVGLASLLAIFVLLSARARRHGTREGWIIVAVIAVFFIPEAPLTMQHGVFLFVFFPLLALYGPRPASPK